MLMITRRIKFRNIKFHLRLSHDEFATPMEIARNAGIANAAVYSVFGAINHVFDISKADIAVAPDFMGKGTKYEVKTDVKASIIFFIPALIKALGVYKRFNKINKK